MALNAAIQPYLQDFFNRPYQLVGRSKKKDTARAPETYVIKTNAHDKFLLLEATTQIEKFYLKRSDDFQAKYKALNLNPFSLNLPVFEKSVSGKFYKLFHYFSDRKRVRSEFPIKELLRHYETNSHLETLTRKRITEIETNFLTAWPVQFHSAIKCLSSYQPFIDELKTLPEARLVLEHGDFTPNNLLSVNTKTYLMDFEFSKENQVVGFDLYDYVVSSNQLDKYKDSIPHLKLNEKKYRLIDEINTLVDQNEAGVIVFKEISPALTIQWQNLYEKGADYNLSYEWCSLWLKYYAKKSTLYIVTIWENGKLSLLAPLIKSRQRLSLIGTRPDLFDQFSVLTGSDSGLKKFAHHVVNTHYELDFRYLNSASKLSKLLVKALYQTKTSYRSHVIDAKPELDIKKFNPPKKLRDDINRCKNRVTTSYNTKLVFTNNLTKTRPVIDALIELHKERWNGGPFEAIDHYKEFITSIFLETNLFKLSRLRLESSKTDVGYHLAYQGTNKILYSNIPAYNKKYDKISPGKVLLFNVISDATQTDITKFDFGRGAEAYKYWFATSEHVLFNIFTQKNRVFVVRLNSLINKVFNKLFNV